MKPLRVFIYVPYPFSKIAGNLRTLLYLLQFAPASGVRCVVVAPFESDLASQVRALGAEWFVLSPPVAISRYGGQVLRDSFLQRLRSVFALVRYNFEVKAFIRSQCIDVVYCDGIRSLMTVGLGAIAARVPRILYMNGEFGNPLLDRLGLTIASRVLFICQANQDDKYQVLLKWFARKTGIVRFGLDLADIRRAQEAAAAVDIPGPGDSIGYLGQLYAPKGVHHLIEAFGRVAPRYPNTTLYLIGDPVVAEYADYVDQLRAQIARLGLESRVVFTGWRDDALAIVSKLTILVHPSMAEGFGRAVMEAMALSKPVIASRVGGLRELVRDGDNGFLVEPGDVDAIADRLDRLLGDAALRERMSAAARETVVREYQVEDKMKQMFRIWYEAAGQQPPAGA